MTEGRKDGMTEGRTKQTLNAPLPFNGGGIKTNVCNIIPHCQAIANHFQSYV